MVTTIIDFLIDEVPNRLRAGLTEDDPDYLVTMERYPLQDDPTARAHFLEIRMDPQYGGRMPISAVSRQDMATRHAMPGIEIGGGFYMVQQFILKGWTPIQDDKDLNMAVGWKAARRLETALTRIARKKGFNNLWTDDGMEGTGFINQTFLLRGSTVEQIGGESEWYSTVEVKFHVFSSINNDYWED